MASAQQIKALIDSHSDGDDSRFYTVALQMAAQEARLGHTQFAKDLRELINHAREKSGQIPVAPKLKPIPIVQPKGELAGLLNLSYPSARMSSMVTEPALQKKLNQILLEQRQRVELREHGLEPARKILFVGPPGTGKTLTASVLANELGLPLFTIQLHGLITKYLGETAAKLHLVFEAMKRTRGIFFFDEFDALGGERGSQNDVGEIRRVLNSFLQFLEQDESDSLILAATNHPKLLDRALFRRFDVRVQYQLPNGDLTVQVMKNRLSLLDTSMLKWNRFKPSAKGLSHADLVRACEQAAKHAILSKQKKINHNDLIAALSEQKASKF